MYTTHNHLLVGVLVGWVLGHVLTFLPIQHKTTALIELIELNIQLPGALGG